MSLRTAGSLGLFLGLLGFAVFFIVMPFIAEANPSPTTRKHTLQSSIQILSVWVPLQALCFLVAAVSLAPLQTILLAASTAVSGVGLLVLHGKQAGLSPAARRHRLWIAAAVVAFLLACTGSFIAWVFYGLLSCAPGEALESGATCGSQTTLQVQFVLGLSGLLPAGIGLRAAIQDDRSLCAWMLAITILLYVIWILSVVRSGV